MSNGLELVDVRFLLEQGGWVLRVCIDRAAVGNSNTSADADGQTMEAFETVDTGDCEQISREISAVMDVEDPIRQAYSLEVSSPGIDRPLTKASHFERFVGSECKVALAVPLMFNGAERRNFRGLIVGVRDGAAVVNVDGTEFSLPIDDIDTARIVPDWDAVMRGDIAGATKPKGKSNAKPGTGKAKGSERKAHPKRTTG